ncbi:MAG TPA: VWA domain-containing protein [Vicinamibacterales bacterium]|nr:VWA domain-containing protein [Vicinamibacterales bacterium]
MSVRRLLAITLVSGFLLPGSARAVEPPAEQFKSSVDVVSVSAVVRDRKGRFVRDLSQRDFVIADAGQSKQILDFRSEADGPVTLGLLMDASGSMRVGTNAVDARQAARQIFSALRQGDEVAIFSFDTKLDRVRGFTRDIASLDGSLDTMNPPFGQTSLHDAIAKAAEAVAAHGRGGGRIAQRSALVVITDGVDTASLATTRQVADAASAIDVPVYVVAVMSPINDIKVDDTPAFDAPGLTRLAQGTGGELFTSTTPAQAHVAAKRIVDELRHQYVIAFEVSAEGGWRSLDVRARNPKLTVRARTGYSAGASGRATREVTREVL